MNRRYLDIRRWKTKKGLSSIEYAVLIGIFVVFGVVFSGGLSALLRGGISPIESDLASGSLSQTIGPVVVSAPREFSLASSELPPAYSNDAYRFNFQTLLTPPRRQSVEGAIWEVVESNTPAGLTFFNGILEGVHTDEEPQYRDITIRASYGDESVEQDYRLLTRAPYAQLLDVVLPAAQQDVAYNFDFDPLLLLPRGVFEKGDVLWSIESGSLPQGLSLSQETGRIFGTYRDIFSNDYPILVRAQGTWGSAERRYVLSTQGLGIALNDPQLIASAPGEQILVNFRNFLRYDEGRFETVSLSITPVSDEGDPISLPSNFTLSGEELLAYPESIEDQSFLFKVSASASDVLVEKTYQVQATGMGISLSSQALPGAPFGGSYVFDMHDRVSVAQRFEGQRITWALHESSSLPEGISFNEETGILSGVVSSRMRGWTNRITIQASLDIQRRASSGYGIHTPWNIAPAEWPQAVAGQFYSHILSSDVSIPDRWIFSSLRWSVLGDTIPLGLTFSGLDGGEPRISGVHNSSIDQNLALSVSVQTPNGSFLTYPARLPVVGRDPWMIAASVNACLVDQDGDMWCAGPSEGLGDPSITTTTNSFGRVRKPLDSGEFIGIATTSSRVCGWEGNGNAWCWGLSQDGELGNGSNMSQPIPTRVDQSAMGPVKKMAVGSFGTCAINRSDDFWCWSRVGRSQPGNTVNFTPHLMRVPDMALGARDITVGNQHACAIDGVGDAWCWGAGSSGQLGNGSALTNHIPTRVIKPVGMAPLEKISAGNSYVCALDALGEVWCWGNAANNRLGRSYSENQTSPVKVARRTGVERYTSIATSNAAACATTNTGDAWCWGNANQGQMGDDVSTGNVSGPVKVLLPVDRPQGFDTLTAAPLTNHFCATARGVRAVWCWGNGGDGRMPNHPTAIYKRPIALNVPQL